MCGEGDGILGMEPFSVVQRMRSHVPNKFSPAQGAVVADAAVFTLDTTTGRVVDIEQFGF